MAFSGKKGSYVQPVGDVVRRVGMAAIRDNGIDFPGGRQVCRLQSGFHPAGTATGTGAFRRRINLFVDVSDAFNPFRVRIPARIVVVKPVDIGKNDQLAGLA